MYSSVVKHLIESTEEVIDTKLKSNRFLNIVEWEKVRKMICTNKYIDEITPY